MALTVISTQHTPEDGVWFYATIASDKKGADAISELSGLNAKNLAVEAVRKIGCTQAGLNIPPPGPKPTRDSGGNISYSIKYKLRDRL